MGKTITLNHYTQDGQALMAGLCVFFVTIDMEVRGDKSRLVSPDLVPFSRGTVQLIFALFNGFHWNPSPFHINISLHLPSISWALRAPGWLTLSALGRWAASRNFCVYTHTPTPTHTYTHSLSYGTTSRRTINQRHREAQNNKVMRFMVWYRQCRQHCVGKILVLVLI